MTFATICSGVDAPALAWRPLGWRQAWSAEIEKFPSAVLAHRHPGVPNHGDFTHISSSEPIDVLCGGTPCQSFSIAGRRAGLDDPRGVLAFEFLRLAQRLRPRWILWENVPGFLSDDEGGSATAWLRAVAECGYGGCYRVLDGQFAGVAQRRERVWFVGYLGDWRPAAAVLFERESLQWNLAPGRTQGENLAGTLDGGSSDRGWCDDTDRTTFVTGTLNANGKAAGSATQQDAESGLLVAFGGNDSGPLEIATARNAHRGRFDFESETLIAHTLRADGFDASEDGTGRGMPLVVSSIGLGSDPLHAEDLAQPITNRNGDPGCIAFTCKDHGADASAVAPTLRAMGHSGSHPNAGGQVAVAFTERGRAEGRNFESQEDLSYCLTNPGSGGRTHSRSIMDTQAMVRRITPREAERLMGMPDDYTLVPTYRKRQREKGEEAERLYEYYCRTEWGRDAVLWKNGRVYATPDGPRYKAIGNSMIVPELAWIGRRIQMVEECPKP